MAELKKKEKKNTVSEQSEPAIESVFVCENEKRNARVYIQSIYEFFVESPKKQYIFFLLNNNTHTEWEREPQQWTTIRSSTLNTETKKEKKKKE